MKQKSIYERYTLKQRINITKQSEAMRTLNSELEKSLDLAKQLTEIAKQTEVKPGKTNAASLRSSSWYGNRVQEQLETTKNRNEFLKREVDETRKIFAKAVHRKNKSEESWHRHEADQKAKREDRNEQEISNRARVVNRFIK